VNNRRYTQSSLDQDRQGFRNQLSGEHDTMEQIAEFTGGRAFYETNGFEQALLAAAEDGANYYTLSYSPSNRKFDGRLRKIHVQVARKGLHLSTIPRWRNAPATRRKKGPMRRCSEARPLTMNSCFRSTPKQPAPQWL
jgi:VWFA-related protein